MFLSGCLAAGSGPARFTAKNSQEIVLSPYYLADPAQGGDHAWFMKLKISDKLPVAGFLKPNQLLSESFAEWIATQKLETSKPLTEAEVAPVAGCSGSYRGALERLAKDDFSGHLVFDNYSDDCVMVFDGTVPFHGDLEGSTGFASVELSVAELNSYLGDTLIRLGGTLQLDLNPGQGTKQHLKAVSRVSLSDASGLRVGLTPVIFSWDRSTHLLVSTYEGALVIPPYGRVGLKTLSPIRIAPGTHKPFDGSLRFEGAGGSWVRLLYAKPGSPGFFRIDGSDGLETIGYL